MNVKHMVAPCEPWNAWFAARRGERVVAISTPIVVFAAISKGKTTRVVPLVEGGPDGLIPADEAREEYLGCCAVRSQGSDVGLEDNLGANYWLRQARDELDEVEEDDEEDENVEEADVEYYEDEDDMPIGRVHARA